MFSVLPAISIIPHPVAKRLRHNEKLFPSFETAFLRQEFYGL